METTKKEKTPMPFSDGNQIFMNACVGYNGIVTNGTYFRGYKKTVDILFEYLNKNQGKYIDSIVYPFLYSCRHILELILKEIIILVPIEPEVKCRDTHSLTTLFDICKNKLNLLDRRFIPFLNEIESYILEIASIDDTGQTFRYAFDNDGIRHLVDDKLSGIINLDVFYQSFSFIEKKLNGMLDLLTLIKKERETGVFTKNLSRYDIENISNKLPKYSTWSVDKDNLKKIKKQIQKEYEISNEELDKAINLIKKHPIFSKNIEQDGLILTCNECDFSFFFR